MGWGCPNPLPDMVVGVLNTGILAEFEILGVKAERSPSTVFNFLEETSIVGTSNSKTVLRENLWLLHKDVNLDVQD